MPDFNRTAIDFSRNFIRGAARLISADITAKAVPTKIVDVVRIAATAQNEVQTVTITGTPAGGTFTLAFKGFVSGTIVYNAASSVVQTALEALTSIGTGGVAVSGGPGPATPYVVTFQNQLAGQNTPMLVANGAALTGGTTPAIGVVETTPGFGQYDAQTGWTELGATKGGVRVLRNNSEEAFDVDQILSDILTLPTGWTMNVSTQIAQVDIDIIQYLWEGGVITLDGSTGERTLPLGAPRTYRQKRLIVGYQRMSTDGGVTPGKIQLFVFRITQRSPQESSFTYNKTGEQVSIPFQWTCVADSTVVDEYARFGAIIDQT